MWQLLTDFGRYNEGQLIVYRENNSGIYFHLYKTNKSPKVFIEKKQRKKQEKKQSPVVLRGDCVSYLFTKSET